MDNVHNRLREVRRQIELACRRANRNPTQITLVGAAKTVDARTLLGCVHAGLRDVGENYAQEGLAKQRELKQQAEQAESAYVQARQELAQIDPANADISVRASDVRWHLIGSLQSNKAKSVVGAFSLIHSVDRPGLAQAIDRAAREREIVQDVLLQVNLGGEASKAGCAPDALEDLMRACAQLPNIAVRGLMALPPFNENPEASRPHFKRLRELGLQARHMSTHAAGEWHLSMGMTRDYPIAIEEGATIIRVGTGLFGSRSQNETS